MVDENKNQDTGKENQSFDDDDFGLPDFEFDALEDDDNDEEEVADFAQNQQKAASSERIEDIFDTPVEEEREEGTIGEESVGEVADDDQLYEDESFGEFDTEETQVDITFDESDDTSEIGLGDNDDSIPFAQYPAPRAGKLSEEDELSEEYGALVTDQDTSGSKSKFVKIVVLGIFLFVLAGFVSLYLSGNLFNGEEDVQKAVIKSDTTKLADSTLPQEDKTKEQVDDSGGKKVEASKKVETKSRKKVAKKTNTSKKTSTRSGDVTTLSAKTNKAYLVVASFHNATFAKRYASKLAGQGQSPTIIPPFGGAPNYRIAVASFANFTEASKNLTSYRQRHGNNIWVLKY